MATATAINGYQMFRITFSKGRKAEIAANTTGRNNQMIWPRACDPPRRKRTPRPTNPASRPTNTPAKPSASSTKPTGLIQSGHTKGRVSPSTQSFTLSVLQRQDQGDRCEAEHVEPQGPPPTGADGSAVRVDLGKDQNGISSAGNQRNPAAQTARRPKGHDTFGSANARVP